MAEGAHYRFEPLQRRGVLLGLGVGQLAVLGGALVVALLLVKTWPGMAGGVGALAALGTGGLLCRPVSGRTPLQWSRIAGSFGARSRSSTARSRGQPISPRSRGQPMSPRSRDSPYGPCPGATRCFPGTGPPAPGPVVRTRAFT